MRIFKVSYWIADYSGEVSVSFGDDEDPEREEIIAKAKSLLRRRYGGSLPFGSESFEIEEEF